MFCFFNILKPGYEASVQLFLGQKISRRVISSILQQYLEKAIHLTPSAGLTSAINHLLHGNDITPTQY